MSPSQQGAHALPPPSKPLLAAARGTPASALPHVPCWFMRQAGRYLPEYMEIRKKADTLTMFRTPKIASEITLQPLRRFPLDAAILYADILLIPDALGLGLSFVTGEGPAFARPVRDAASLAPVLARAENLDTVLRDLSYVGETLELVRPQLAPEVALIGFAGAPWTVASYMIEGRSTHGEFPESKKLLLNQPEVLHGVLRAVTLCSKAYLEMQVRAGAEILQLFESWSGALTPGQYREFAAPYAREILEHARGLGVPVIHFLGASAALLDDALVLPMDVFGVDWHQDLERVRARPEIAGRCLQGNLDPAYLFAPGARLEAEAKRILEAGTSHPGGFIFNLGHGIRVGTDPSQVAHLTRVIQNFKIA